MAGKAIRLFLVDGISTGLLTAEIPTWTGHVLVAPRARLHEALSRPEAIKTGVYILIGEEAGRTMVYVGEGDCIGDRVKAHARDTEKDFWERVCLITCKDVNLTKSHARFLESSLVQIIREGGRADLVNGNAPPLGTLPEADLSDMQIFLEHLQILLPTVGMDFLRGRSKVPRENPSIGNLQAQGEEPVFFNLSFKKHGIFARGFYDDGEMIVLKGSIGTASIFKVNQYAPLRQQLLDQGKLKLLEDGRVEFTEDVAFKSPSAAAAVLNNCNSSGPRDWKVEANGQPLGEWRNAQLETN